VLITTPLLVHVERSGFAAPDSLIHLFIGGSELHGAKVGVTDDLDLYGVFIGLLRMFSGLILWNISFGLRRVTIDGMGRRMWI
jgi:hypothetical protein